MGVKNLTSELAFMTCSCNSHKYCDPLFYICLLLPSPISIYRLTEGGDAHPNQKRDIRKKLD